jgi:hypothetical protein
VKSQVSGRQGREFCGVKVPTPLHAVNCPIRTASMSAAGGNFHQKGHRQGTCIRLACGGTEWHKLPPHRAKSEPNPSLTILSINIYNASNEINKFYFLISPFYSLYMRNAALGCCLLPPWYRSTAYCTDDSELMPVPTGVILRVALPAAECDCTNDHR